MATNDPDTPASRWRSIASAVAGALIVLGLVGAAWTILSDTGSRNAASSRIGGPFRLQSSAGGILDSDILLGKPFLVTFGFTRCPSTCPTTLAELTSLIDTLKAEGKSIDAFFVTVDPERDTAATMREYLTSFSDRITGLTGTVDEIAQVGRLYRAFVQKVPTGPGDYTFEHTTSVYLMDADGRLVVPLDLDNAYERGVAEVRRVLNQRSPTSSTDAR
ncbi:hypothetical protein ASG60_08340 [Methylobacterium sp. Leaf469]|uniref:SCO family protein n=1 Tax=Methylobacterium sp. Leaf469 TaxID=1736387 RepID=UPI0006F7DEBB|nr:SCO family protein [Methylobacterium sp. Leaf469]KQT93364.1 hypothetical protein ASG60_08340 [Methylobacterium sp. Leaf469]